MAEVFLTPKELLTKEQLQAVINEKLGNTLYWLSKAYRLRPKDDQSEKTLLEMMASLQKIQDDVNRAFTGKRVDSKVAFAQRGRNA